MSDLRALTKLRVMTPKQGEEEGGGFLFRAKATQRTTTIQTTVFSRSRGFPGNRGRENKRSLKIDILNVENYVKAALGIKWEKEGISGSVVVVIVASYVSLLHFALPICVCNRGERAQEDTITQLCFTFLRNAPPPPPIKEKQGHKLPLSLSL